MRKIAIIDDDVEVNDLLKSLVLNVPDVEVTQAFDLPSAEKLVASQQFDLVIVDIDLGEGVRAKFGGLAILSILSGKATVTLVVSGTADQVVPEIALSLRAYDFVGKPIKPMVFMNAFEHALESARAMFAASPTPGGLPPNMERDPTQFLGLRWKGKQVPLTLTQHRLVECLIAQAGHTAEFSKLRKQLDSSTSNQAIATHMSDIRARFLRIDPEFSAIDSDPGKGYVWKIGT
jgi:DNA-binding response OmpR family regulator